MGSATIDVTVTIDITPLREALTLAHGRAALPRLGTVVCLRSP